jgi:cytochrome c nitrite reductase small subunit
MKTGKLLQYSSMTVFVVAIGVFVYLVNASRALSYLSADPKACINCHVMNTSYATWQHSAHGRDVTCIQCHLPTGSVVDKYLAKMRDGWNHSSAFTMNTFAQRIRISDDAAERVQTNCISCHAVVTGTIRANSDRYHDFTGTAKVDRKCWECHRDVPHGKARSLAAAPNNLGVRELK